MTYKKFILGILFLGFGNFALAEEYIVRAPMQTMSSRGSTFTVKELSPGQASALLKRGFKVEKNVRVQLPPFSIKKALPLSTVIWPMEMIKAPAAHKLENGRGENVKVCVIDTGVNKKHPLVGPAILEGKSFVGNDPEDISDAPVEHGTAVASLIVGRPHGNFVGAAPAAQLIVAKAFEENGATTMAKVLDAFKYCMGKADIINMSFGGGVSSAALSELMSLAHEKGITLVAASGNSPGPLSYPANDPAVLAVSMVDESGNTSIYSPTDSRLSFVAPGVKLPTLNSSLETVVQSGSSFSAAIVSGVEAIRRSRGSKNLVATPLPLPEDQQGHGLIDALATALNVETQLASASK